MKQRRLKPHKIISLSLFLLAACALVVGAWYLNFQPPLANEPDQESTFPAAGTIADSLTRGNFGLDSYSAVVTVVRDSDLKILNFEVFNRADNHPLEPKEEWLNVVLNQKKQSFSAACRSGFLITDCSGGAISRLDDNQACSRAVEKDLKNTISLECQQE